MDQPPFPIGDETTGPVINPSMRSTGSDSQVAADDAAPSNVSPFRIDEDDRYSRLRLISWWRQERLAAAKILVVGSGALGNEVMKNLALVGVGTIYLIDFDVVEPSNLSRSVLFRAHDGGKPKALVAASRALELNPEINIVAMHGDVITDLGLGLFAEVDLVIGCLDNREARLWVNRQCWKTSTPWIDAGIQEIQGVVKVFVPPDSACYECAMTERDYQLLNLRYSCPLLKRDEILAGKVPTAPTIASMMAALQVQEALKLLHDLPVAAGSALVFSGVGNQFYSTRLPFREDCLSHETYPAPVEIPLSHGSTVADLFAAAKAELDPPLSLGLDRELVVAVDCPRCGWRQEIMKPQTKVSQGDAICPTCHELGRPELLSTLEQDSPLVDRTLASVGVPAYDVVRVDGGSGSRFFLLAGDRSGRDSGWELNR
jgi:adenylyltransferase/sulfurtransferase